MSCLRLRPTSLYVSVSREEVLFKVLIMLFPSIGGSGYWLARLFQLGRFISCGIDIDLWDD